MIRDLEALLERVAEWPREDRDDLFEAAIDIEIRRLGHYFASPGELKSIDDALDEVAKGLIATDDEVENLVGRYRRP